MKSLMMKILFSLCIPLLQSVFILGHLTCFQLLNKYLINIIKLFLYINFYMIPKINLLKVFHYINTIYY